MNYFNDKDKLISTHDTDFSKKRQENFEKMVNILEGYDTEREIDNAIDIKEDRILNEDFHNTLKTELNKTRIINENRTRRLNENATFIDNNFDNVCRDLFFYTVYESLLIDDSIKTDNFNYIRESSDKFFNDMMKRGCISIKENSGFSDIINTAMRIMNEELNSDSFSLENVVKKTVLSEDMMLFFATESIKYKTAECVKNEKRCSVLKEELMAENKYVDPSKTLFRYLFENNIQSIIDESGETNGEKIQDLSLIETILDYTILEAANTLQIVSFGLNLNNVINR